MISYDVFNFCQYSNKSMDYETCFSFIQMKAYADQTLANKLKAITETGFNLVFAEHAIKII